MAKGSKQTNQSSQTDARSAADNGAIAVGGSNNTISVTDGGLVERGVELLKAGDQANTDRLAMMLEGAGKLLTFQSEMARADSEKFAALLDSKKSADTPASQELAASLGKTMVFGAVALVAVAVFARGAK